jgi:hypothetical protein
MTDEAGDRIAVKRTPDEGLENENIERTAKKLEAGFLHANHSPWNP